MQTQDVIKQLKAFGHGLAVKRDLAGDKRFDKHAEGGEKFLDAFFLKALNAHEGADREKNQERALKLHTDALVHNDSGAIRQLNAFRTEMMQNLVVAQGMHSTMFFEEINLADNEEPRYENKTNQEITVKQLSEEGTPESIGIVKPRKFTDIDLYYTTTPAVEYNLIDIYQGRLSPEVQMSGYDLSRDVQEDIDTRARALYLSGALKANFNDEATDPEKSWVAHSKINTSNLPTTNKITQTSANTTSLPTYVGLNQIIKYCTQFGNIFGGPLAPTGALIVPSIHASAITESVNPTTAQSNAFTEAIITAGYQTFPHGGYQWVVMPDVTLAPKKLYPVLNRPVGQIFYKPGLDIQSDVATDAPTRRKRSFQKVVGMAIPSNRKPFALELEYQTTS